MRVTFWLLDVNLEVREGIAEIWLWGIDDAGNRVLVVDRSYVSSFYALARPNSDPATVAKDIDREHLSTIIKTEAVNRRLFGKPVKTLKIYCRDPDVVSQCTRTLRKIEGVEDIFEDDIRHSMRYLIDNNVVPCGWHEAEVVEEKSRENIQADKTYVAESPPRLIENDKIPQLKILGFSTICCSKEGSPKPEKDPVIVISTATNRGEEKQFLAGEDKNDKPVLEAFAEYVRNFNPDIIVGFGTSGQDWMYLNERCQRHGLSLHVDRAKSEPHTSVYGHVSLAGRANLDLLDFAGEFPEVKVQTLANLADYLNVLKIVNRELVEDVDFADYWDAKEKRAVLQRFSMDNTRCIMGIANAVLDFAMQLSNLVSLPLDHVGAATAGSKVEWFLMKHTRGTGELVPKRIEQPYQPYAGGIVLKPVPGLHENIAALDFKSMYPSLMIAYNISPDTYISAENIVPCSEVHEAPEVKHRFVKEPPGFYREALSYLISVRDEIRSEMKLHPQNSPEHRVLDARQKAVKIITNAAYGYAGWTGARWYMKPVAEAAAAWGRDTISKAIRMAEEVGLRVVYGDTDSIFASNEPDKTQKLSQRIEKDTGLEMKPDKTYVRIFFTEAKKRYAGLLTDGRLDIVGLEVIRGDWAAIAKKVQEKVLEIILKEKSPKKAAESVQQSIQELRRRQVPYRDLVIWKTLTKPAEEYVVRAAHVEAARMLMERGWRLTAGDKVGYVVVRGSGRLYEHVKPHAYASYDEIDGDYYVTSQIVPAAARVLESFGVTEEQLLQFRKEERKTRELSDFFGG